MDTRDISLILSKDTYSRRVFKGVFPRNKLSDPGSRGPSAYVINTDPDHRPGEHWVGVWFNGKGGAEYFDSLGLPPLHQDIKKFINKNSFAYSRNRRPVQPLLSYTCGLYVIYFILMKSRGATMGRVLAPFHPLRGRANDRYVYRFVRAYTSRI